MQQLESRKIAVRYAKALQEAADEQGELKAVTDNIRLLQSIYLEVPELNRFFANPTIPINDKQEVIEQQFKKGITPLVGTLLDLLLENNRIEYLPEIVSLYIQMIKDKEGIAQAEVIVPVAISESQENKLRTTLERLFGYHQVELNTKVDPAIIAGAIVKIGDKIIDGSYHGKLETLRRQVG